MENNQETFAMAVNEEVVTNLPAEEPATHKDTPTAGDMVEQAFTQAVVATVKNDEKVQSDIMHSAEKVIRNKTHELKTKAEIEAKEAHFNNKKGACECFGYNESTTEKWAVSFMGAWHNIMTALWIVIGMFTFAPITFVAKKLSVIIKSAWLAVVVAIIIYAIVALSPFWVNLLSNLNGGSV